MIDALKFSEQDELYKVEDGNSVTISHDHNKCTNVPPNWSGLKLSFDVQPQCVLLYPRQNCAGVPKTVYQAFNGSEAVSFKKCNAAASKDANNKLTPLAKRPNTFDLQLLSVSE